MGLALLLGATAPPFAHSDDVPQDGQVATAAMQGFLSGQVQRVQKLEDALTQTRGPGMDATRAGLLKMLAWAHFELGDYQAALEAAEEEVKLLRGWAGPQADSLAGALDDVGVMYGEVGEHGKALAAMQEKMEILRRADPSRAEGFLLNLAWLYGDEIGEYEKCLDCGRRCMTALRQYDTAWLERGNCLQIMGRAYCALGRHGESLACLVQAERSYPHLLNPSAPLAGMPREVYRCEASLGRTYWRRGEGDDLYQAYRHYARAVKVVEHLRSHPTLGPEARAVFFSQIGWVYDEMVGLLLDMKRRGLPLDPGQMEEDEPEFWGQWLLEGPRLWQGWGSYDEAAFHYAEASRARAAQDLLADRPLAFANAEGRQAWLRFSELTGEEARLAKALRAARAAGDARREADVNAEAERVRAERRKVEGRLWPAAFGQIAGPVDVNTGEVQRLLGAEEGVVEYKTIPGGLAVFMITASGLQVREVGLAGLGTDLCAAAWGHVPGEERLRKGFEMLAPTRPLVSEMADAWRADPAKAASSVGLLGLVWLAREPMEAAASGAPPLLSPAEHLRVLAGLYELLARPVEELADREGLKHLAVVPDGPLCYLPVAALVESMPEDDAELGPHPYASPRVRYALDRWGISYLPSVGMYAAMLDQAKQRPEPGRRLCVFADPVFSASDPRARGVGTVQIAQSGGAGEEGLAAVTRAADDYWRGGGSDVTRLPRLPNTSVEAVRALRAFGGGEEGMWTRPDAPARWAAAQGFAGLGAVEARAYAPELADYGYVLIATHGCIDAEHPMYSYLAFTPREVLAAGEGQAGGPGSPTDDGRLTLGEAFGMALNARVVTLSACRTGLGQYRRGEGVMGLALALFCSGARAVTVSLWAVDDARTADLMGGYHERMAAGAPPLEALVAAQREMLGAARRAAAGPGADAQGAAGANPYLWAPFLLIGQW